MQNPPRRSVSVLLAGVRCSPFPPSSLPAALRSATCSRGMQLTLFKARRGTGGAHGAAQTYQSPRGAPEAAAEQHGRDGSPHGPAVSLGWGPQGQSWRKRLLHLGTRCQAGAAGGGWREPVPWAAHSIFWEQRPGPRRGEVVTGTQRVPWAACPVPALLQGAAQRERGFWVSPPTILAAGRSLRLSCFKQLPENAQTSPVRMGTAEVYWLSPRC